MSNSTEIFGWDAFPEWFVLLSKDTCPFPSARRCHHADVRATMTNGWTHCPYCGQALSGGEVSCRNCGARLSKTEGDVTDELSMTSVEALRELETELREALAPEILLLGQLGQGGMGIVFVARDPALKRLVVVKVLAPALSYSATARARFAREAEAAAAVSHPNVVSVYRVGDLPRLGTTYFVMEYVDGVTLGAAFFQGQTVPESRVKRIVGEVASALEAAHARDLVHRDIKPSNIMIEEETGRAVVLDFGISAATSSERWSAQESLTAQGALIGTPQYMSPEQAAQRKLTDRSDIYSLGAVAFELVTGQPVFTESTPMELVAAHINRMPPTVASLRADLDPQFAALIDRMLSKETEARPSASEVHRVLLPPQHPAIEWPPPGLDALQHAGARFGRALLLAVAIGLVFFVLLHVAPTYNSALWQDGELSGFWFTVAGGPRTETFGGLIPRRDPTAAWLLLLGGSVLCVVGIGMFTLGRGIKFGATLTRARWAGYPTGVCLDVAFDGDADTAKLINGTGAYASLNPAQRERLRRYRRWRAALPIATSAFTVLTALTWLVVWDAAGGGAGTIVSLPALVFILLPMAMGLLLHAVLGTVEVRSVERPRLSFKQRLVRLRQPMVSRDLAGVWLDNIGVSAPATGGAARKVLLGLLPQVITLVTIGAFLGTLLLILGVSLRTSQFVAAHRQAATEWEEARRAGTVVGWTRLEAALAGSNLMRRRTPVTDSSASFEMLRVLTSIDSTHAPTLLSDQRFLSESAAWSFPDTELRFDLAFPPHRRSRENASWMFSSLLQHSSVTFAGDVRSRLVEDTAFTSYGIWRRFAKSEPPPLLWMYREEFGGLLSPFRVPPLNHDRLFHLMDASRAAALLALERGDIGAALDAVGDIVSVGRILAREPAPDVHEIGLTTLHSGLGSVAQMAAFVGDEGLRREADSLRRLVPSTHVQFVEFGTFLGWGSFKWGLPIPPAPLLLTAAGGSSSGVPLLADSVFRHADRWALILAIVPAFCASQREVLLGIDPRRKRALEAALQSAGNLPRTDEWVRLNIRWFEAWRDSSSAARQAWYGSRPDPPALPKPLAWLGLGGLFDRIVFCWTAVWA